MPIRIDVWSDFVCPFCYAASLSLKELAQNYEIDVRWHSFELRPQGSPPVPPEYQKRIAETQPQLADMLRQQFGVEVQFGPMGVNSRPALIADKYAEAQGADVGAAFHAAVNDAYWLEGRDLEDVQVLKDIATQVGLDGETLVAALADPRYVAEVDADIEQAQAYGFSGVPALVFENQYLVSGFRPPEVLAQVVEKLQVVSAAE